MKYITVYKIPDVDFPVIPDFDLLYNIEEVNGFSIISSVTILWEQWLRIEKYMLENELQIEILYSYQNQNDN